MTIDYKGGAELPVVSIFLSHANAGGIVLANARIFVAECEFLVAEVARPTRLASALPRSSASAMNAARVRHTFCAICTNPTDATMTCPWSSTSSMFPATTRRTNGCNRWQIFIRSLYILCNVIASRSKQLFAKYLRRTLCKCLKQFNRLALTSYYSGPFQNFGYV